MTTATIKPRRLTTGATIGIVSPSEPINEEDFDHALEFLRARGYGLVIGPHARERDGHLAGTDEDRASDIMQMFVNPDVDAIFCSAGGANSGRLLPLLNYDTIRAHPKVFLGMSDPSALLCAIHARTGLVTFHGPVVQYNMREPFTELTGRYFDRALFTGDPVGEIAEIRRDNVLRGGSAKGRLIGGNLTTVQQLLGTPYEPDWNGAIFFWEDVCEQPHALDAKLTQFRNAGVFERIAGMIVGRLEACDEQEYAGMPPIDDIVLELSKRWAFPILRDVPFGHTTDKITLPLGVTAEITADSLADRAVLTIVESGTK